VLQLVYFLARLGVVPQMASAVHSTSGKTGRSARSSWTMIFVILLIGLGVGVLVGLLGIGGGVVLVPALVYMLHMEQHVAAGTSLFILLPPLGAGALREYWRQGQVDLRAGILCAAGMLVGAYGGSAISIHTNSQNLKGFFGCFLMLAALLLWIKTDDLEQLPVSALESQHDQ
jgi:uncharacterized protein